MNIDTAIESGLKLANTRRRVRILSTSDVKYRIKAAVTDEDGFTVFTVRRDDGLIAVAIGVISGSKGSSPRPRFVPISSVKKCNIPLMKVWANSLELEDINRFNSGITFVANPKEL